MSVMLFPKAQHGGVSFGLGPSLIGSSTRPRGRAQLSVTPVQARHGCWLLAGEMDYLEGGASENRRMHIARLSARAQALVEIMCRNPLGFMFL